MKCKRVFEVPIEHTGNGGRGYLLKEWIWNKGKNSNKPKDEVVDGLRRANSVRNIGY